MLEEVNEAVYDEDQHRCVHVAVWGECQDFAGAPLQPLGCSERQGKVMT